MACIRSFGFGLLVFSSSEINMGLWCFFSDRHDYLKLIGTRYINRGVLKSRDAL